MGDADREKDRITWKWAAGVGGAILFAMTAAWAAKVENSISEVGSLKTSIQYIQLDIQDIKILLRDYLKERK